MVAVLIFGSAVWAGAADQTIGKKGFFDRVERLLNVTLGEQIGGFDLRPYFFAQHAILFGVGTAVVVEFDAEGGKVALVILLHLRNKCRFSDTRLFGGNHDRGAMRIVTAKITAIVTAKFLEPHPDVGLQVLDHVTDVNRPIGVRQSRGDK